MRPYCVLRGLAPVPSRRRENVSCFGADWAGVASAGGALGGELLGESLGEARVVVAGVVELGGDSDETARRGGPAHDGDLDAPAVEEPSLEGIGAAPADLGRR